MLEREAWNPWLKSLASSQGVRRLGSRRSVSVQSPQNADSGVGSKRPPPQLETDIPVVLLPSENKCRHGFGRTEDAVGSHVSPPPATGRFSPKMQPLSGINSGFQPQTSTVGSGMC